MASGNMKSEKGFQNRGVIMKKGFIIASCIILTHVLIIGTYALHFKNQMSWHVHEPMTAEQKTDYAYKSLMPGTADIIERYADRGLRDSEYMVESRAFSSLNELIQALPEGSEESIRKTMEEADPEQTTDIKGNAVTRYGVLYELPKASREELGKKYEYYTYGCRIGYYILQYEDGTYRFASVIANM